LVNGSPVGSSSPSVRLANKPFEWTGCRHVVSMAIGARLPLKGSVSRITSEGAVRQCSSDGLAIVGEKASVTSVARKA
jgi:hypothetical protein